MLKAMEGGVPDSLLAISIRERMVRNFVIGCSEEGRTSANLIFLFNLPKFKPPDIRQVSLV